MMADTPVQLGRSHALLLWIRGRSAPVPAHSTVFTAQRGSLGLPLMFGAATVIEMVVLHLLIPWLWLSALVAALSVASLVLLASSIALARLHPHILSPTTLTLRTSGKVVATVDRASIASARIHRRYGVVSPALDGSRLVLPNQDGTSVDIELTGATDVALPALLQRHRVSGSASSFSVQVDDPAALVAGLTRLTGPPVLDRRSNRVVNNTTTDASQAVDAFER
ncbi:hypothetical protein HQO83_15285 [Rhodococcus fascians]|nr:hypothetical protein [Rhodococcus fascians]